MISKKGAPLQNVQTRNLNSRRTPPIFESASLSMNPLHPKIHNFIGPYGPCIELANSSGLAIVALLGGQLISWVPVGGTEVFWLTEAPAPLPAPLRGGVPICWPWFARQGVPNNYPQHGVVRNLPWKVHSSDIQPDQLGVTLVPDWSQCPPATLTMVENALGIQLEHLHLTQHLLLGQGQLKQTLHTVNSSDRPLRLTQALHSYFRVGDVRKLQVHGLQGKDYLDKLQGFARFHQAAPWAFDSACDRIYIDTEGHFTLTDPILGRTIVIRSENSESLVVWNPGAATALDMVDIGETLWPDFFCLEASQAEPKGVSVSPGASCSLSQTLECHPLLNPDLSPLDQS